MKYIVEGWSRGQCVGVRSVARPATVIREAYHLTLDLGADVVWVRRDGDAIFDFNGVRWMKHRGDDDLAAAIDKLEGASL